MKILKNKKKFIGITLFCIVVLALFVFIDKKVGNLNGGDGVGVVLDKLSKEDYISTRLSEETLTLNSSEDIYSSVTEEQLRTNLDLAYLIYQTRDSVLNESVDIIVNDTTEDDRNKLWEGYIIPGELENYAVSIDTSTGNLYMTAILKPKESSKLNVYDSIKLLRSGYLGNLSDVHNYTITDTYVQEVNGYIVVCLNGDAVKVGNQICESLSNYTV